MKEMNYQEMVDIEGGAMANKLIGLSFCGLGVLASAATGGVGVPVAVAFCYSYFVIETAVEAAGY